MIRFIKIATATTITAMLLICCGKSGDAENIVSQYKAITSYVGKLDSTKVRIYEAGYKVVVTASDSTKPVAMGDSVIFYYTAATFNQGIGKVFDTNIDSIARKHDFDSTVVRTAYRTIAGSNNLVRGLSLGLLHLYKGESAQLIFTSDYGYGDKDMGIIPPNTPLIFEVTVADVK